MKTESQSVGDHRSWRQVVVEKATTQQTRPSGPPVSLETSWWEDAGMRTCPREAGHPGPRLSSPGERERHTAMSGGAGEVNILQFCSVSNSLSRTQPFQIKGEVYFFLRSLRSSLFIASICLLHVYAYMCSIWLYNMCVCVNLKS